MAKPSARREHTPPATLTAKVEMKNVDMPYGLVEGVQGMLTPNGNLAVNFFSETVRPKEHLAGQSPIQFASDGSSATVQVQFKDPFGLDEGSIDIVRVVEANLVFSERSLRTIIPWFQQKLNEIQQSTAQNKVQEHG